MTADMPSHLLPKLRFPEFRDAPEWSMLRGDSLFNSINIRSAAPGLPVLAITQEHGAIPRDQIDYHVSVTAESVASYKEVCEDDFIISLRSFQGGIEHSQYHGICSPAYVILRRKGVGNDHFFRHLFKTERFIQQMTRNIEGIRDGKMISYAQFSEQLLPVPEPSEQQKIADCLGSLDDLIAAVGRKLEALRQHKQGLMQQLFPQPGETVPRLRFPEFRDAGEWEEKKIGDLSKVKASGDLDVAYFSSFQSTTHLYPVYSNAVENAGLYGYYSLPQYKKNSVTITARGTLGVAFLRNHEFMGIGRLIVVSDLRNLDPCFLKECWNHLAVIPREVTSIPQLTAIAVRATVLPIPRPVEQQRIATCLSSLEDVLAAQARKIDALKQQKQGLLQQLFPSLEME